MMGKQQHSFTHFTLSTVFTDFTFFCKAEMCMPADDTSHKESSSDEDSIPALHICLDLMTNIISVLHRGVCFAVLFFG